MESWPPAEMLATADQEEGLAVLRETLLLENLGAVRGGWQ